MTHQSPCRARGASLRSAAVSAAAALCSFTALLSLSACSNSDQQAEQSTQSPYGAVAIVMENTAANPVPALSDSNASLVSEFLTGSDAITLISATGEPKAVPLSLNKLKENGTRLGNKRIAQNNVLVVQHTMSETTPDAKEQNMLEALTQANDYVSSNAGGKQGLIIAIGNGLETGGGAMDMTSGLLDARSSNDIADYVHQSDPGLSFKNVDIRMQGLGYVADNADQPKPDDAQRRLLVDVWTKTLAKFGAHVTVDNTPVSGASVAKAKHVSIVRLPSTSKKCESRDVKYTVPSALLFDGDSATLHSNAADALAEPAKMLLDSDTTHAEVIGHTASTAAYTQQEHITLSTERAEAVAHALIAQGVHADQITTRGVGDSEPLAEDLNPDGTQNANAAAERRIDLVISGTKSCLDK